VSVFADIFRSKEGALAWVIGALRGDHAATVRRGERAAPVTVITAESDLSSSQTVRTMYANVKRAIADTQSKSILVDLSDVHIADTKTVACLVVLRRAATRAGKRLDVRLSPAVAAWTGVCRLQRLLDEEHREPGEQRSDGCSATHAA